MGRVILKIRRQVTNVRSTFQLYRQKEFEEVTHDSRFKINFTFISNFLLNSYAAGGYLGPVGT